MITRISIANVVLAATTLALTFSATTADAQFGHPGMAQVQQFGAIHRPAHHQTQPFISSRTIHPSHVDRPFVGRPTPGLSFPVVSHRPSTRDFVNPGRPQTRILGGDPSTWGPGRQSQGRPVEIGMTRTGTIGRAIGGSRNGVSGEVAGEVSGGVTGGLSIDPRTGRVRGGLQAGIQGNVMGGVSGPAGGIMRQFAGGITKGISFEN